MKKKLWQGIDSKKVNLHLLGYKEINSLDASRKFVKGFNIFIKFYYHNFDTHKLVESPLFFLDKNILKNKTIPKYSAFDTLFQSLKIHEVFPYSIMSFFIFTDGRTTPPREFIKADNQLLLDFG